MSRELFLYAVTVCPQCKEPMLITRIGTLHMHYACRAEGREPGDHL